MVKFTNKVRRGLRQMLERKLEKHVQRAIELATAPGLSRDQRMTAAEQEELLAAVGWMKQAVAALEVAEDVAADLGREAGEPGTSKLAAALEE